MVNPQRIRSAVPPTGTIKEGLYSVSSSTNCPSKISFAIPTSSILDISLSGGRTLNGLTKQHKLDDIPASTSIRSNSLPEEQTKGTPAWSSSAPGASPTIQIGARGSPLNP